MLFHRLLPLNFGRILHFFVGFFLRELRGSKQLLGMLLKMLLMNAIVKWLLMSKLSGFIVKE